MSALNSGGKPANTRVLIVDDEPAICLLLKELLSQAGFDCQTAPSGNAALDILQQHEFDALISDLYMPGISGLALLESARARYPGMRLLLATGGAEEQAGVDAVGHGADGYVLKPFRLDAVVAALRRVLEPKP